MRKNIKSSELKLKESEEELNLGDNIVIKENSGGKKFSQFFLMLDECFWNKATTKYSAIIFEIVFYNFKNIPIELFFYLELKW